VRAWAARYEDLRRQIVNERRPVSAGWGLALFVRRGAVAWMEGWPRPEELAEAGAGRAQSIEPAQHGIALPGALQTQIATVLAGVVLSRWSAPPRAGPQPSGV
jgi:hypothetical protein